MPRPRTAADDQVRTETLNFRASKEEKATIEEAAKAFGHERYGPWLRELALREAAKLTRKVRPKAKKGTKAR